MRTSFQTNLRCDACLAKVRPFLDDEPSIATWAAQLDDPRKLLTVTWAGDANADRVLNLFIQTGYKAHVVPPETVAIGLENEDGENQVETQSKSFQLSNYKPLLLVVCYVLGATVLMQCRADVWSWTRAMSDFMGFFFLGFAFFKLLNLRSFADAFSNYDVLAKRFRPYAVAYPWIELGLGILFVTGTALVLANVVTILVMGFGLIGVIQAVRKEQPIQCACLGTVFNLPMSVVTIIENSVMVVMATAMLILGR